MAFRLAQVSDAHLSASRPFFAGNFARVAEAVRAARPDLLVATGDLSLDGADCDEDLRHAEREHARVAAEWVAVPGNHDVGDDLGAQRVTPERLSRWKRVLGHHGFVRDIPGWRLVGWDTQSLAAAPSQWDALEDAIRTAGPRRVALFQHKPLCEERLSDTRVNYWPVLPADRARLLALFEGGLPALVASGHVHQWLDRQGDGIRQVWAPSTGFVVGAPWQWTWGERRLGWVEHVFHADGGHEAVLHGVPGVAALDIGAMPEVYGPLPRLVLPVVPAD